MQDFMIPLLPQYYQYLIVLSEGNYNPKRKQKRKKKERYWIMIWNDYKLRLVKNELMLFNLVVYVLFH